MSSHRYHLLLALGHRSVRVGVVIVVVVIVVVVVALMLFVVGLVVADVCLGDDVAAVVAVVSGISP